MRDAACVQRSPLPSTEEDFEELCETVADPYRERAAQAFIARTRLLRAGHSSVESSIIRSSTLTVGSQR